MKKLLAFAALLGSVGCSNIIDTPPETQTPTEVALSNPANVQAIVNYCYGSLMSGSASGVGGQFIPSVYIINDVISDHLDGSSIVLDNFLTEIRQRNDNAFNLRNRGVWAVGYNVVLNANQVIDAVNRGVVQGTTQQQLDQWRGEALFLRALVHFELVRLWGFSYSLNSGSGIGVVIRNTLLDGESADQEVDRSSTSAVYDQVIEDLTAAAALLPDDPDAATAFNRATSWAAKALLARVYFHQLNYAQALTVCTDIIDNSPFVLTDNIAGQYGAAENIALPEGVIFQFVPGFNTELASYRAGSSAGPLDDATGGIIDRLNNNVNDQRFSALIETSGGNSFTRKWTLAENFNIPYLRMAEVYLIRAESAAQASNTTLANSDLNAVRDAAITGAYTPLNLTGAGLLSAIRTELEFEMVAENGRYHELRRQQAADIRGLPYDSQELLLAIPLEETAGNPNLTLN